MAVSTGWNRLSFVTGGCRGGRAAGAGSGVAGLLPGGSGAARRGPSKRAAPAGWLAACLPMASRAHTAHPAPLTRRSRCTPAHAPLALSLVCRRTAQRGRHERGRAAGAHQGAGGRRRVHHAHRGGPGLQQVWWQGGAWRVQGAGRRLQDASGAPPGVPAEREPVAAQVVCSKQRRRTVSCARPPTHPPQRAPTHLHPPACSELVEEITRVKGANYFSVHTPGERRSVAAGSSTAGWAV